MSFAIQYVLGCPESLSFTDTSFITTHLYTNMKPNLSNVVIFILIEQNGSYVIRYNNMKRKMCIHYFLIKQKKLFGRPNSKFFFYLVEFLQSIIIENYK